MDPMITALLRSEAYPHPTGPITLVETHISWVLLTGSYAYKVKKPVNLGFVDFSSLQKRRHFCQEELRLNQRLAPELYLAVVEIHGPAEQATVGGAGPLIDVAVRMRQFDPKGLLAHALSAELVSAEQFELFADRLAAFHAKAAVAPPEGPFGTPDAVVAPAMANLEVLRRFHLVDPQDSLHAWTHREAERLGPHFSRRLLQGRVREGHGDLHLGNLVLHQEEVVAFDCLEFNAALRWIDVLSDVAFLAMNLQQCGQAVLAGRLLNRWLSGSGDYQGLASWPWYLTYRALVRAKVLALQLKQRGGTHAPGRTDLQQQLGAYLHQAWSSSQGAGPAALILTHGVSGSGKSHLATQLCQRHGWIHLRSDVERRRLFGLWGTPEDVPRKGERYSPSITAELYGTILPRAADAALQAGLTTIVDATFLKQSQRATFLELAKTHQAPLVILMCPVSLALARERISQRRQTGLDPSEADDSVLTQQWSSQESPQPSEGIPLIVHSLREAEDQLAMVLPSLFKTTR